MRGTLSASDNSGDESLVTGGGSRPLRRNFRLSPRPSPGWIVTRTLSSNARPGTSPPKFLPPSSRGNGVEPAAAHCRTHLTVSRACGEKTRAGQDGQPGQPPPSLGPPRAQMGGQEVTDSGQRKRQKDVPEGEVGTSGRYLTGSPEGTILPHEHVQLSAKMEFTEDASDPPADPPTDPPAEAAQHGCPGSSGRQRAPLFPAPGRGVQLFSAEAVDGCGCFAPGTLSFSVPRGAETTAPPGEPSVEELFSKVIEVNAAPALLEIVDTVGAEHLVTLKDLYIKNSDGFVVLYSVCSEASFEAVRPLRERMGRLRGPKAVPLVLVGTKADLDAQRQVLTAQGRALAREWRCPFLEVTAKSKLMVDQVFTQVVREMEALAPPEEVVPAVPTNAQETWPSERFIG
nr:PREDICTED: uncharacterized protein LOC102270894 [Bos mutus]